MDRSIELLVEFLSGQEHQAPGSEASTLRALRAVGPLPERPRVADLGCGRGASAVVLARATGGEVLALDLLPQMVEAVAARSEEALPGTLRAVVGDMLEPPVEPGSLNLIWSEGAAYAVGIEEALAAWRPLLNEGGGLVVSELAWRGEEAPEECRAWWAQGYPAMDTREAFLAKLEAAGFTLVEHFWLPRSDWAAYYEPQEARMEAFLAAHPDDEVAQAVVEEMRAEIQAWRRWGAHFGYVMAVGHHS